jgi:hypothetical protein
MSEDDIMWGFGDSSKKDLDPDQSSGGSSEEKNKMINLQDADEESIIRSTGADDDIVITFTAAQKLRWNERIKTIMFETDSVEDYVDGSFMGTIADPVGEIIQTHIVTDAIMSVDDYSTAVEKCQMELIQYISENTKGVHVLFIINFTAHFLQTILSTVYNVGDVATDLIPITDLNDSDSFFYA